MTDADRTDPPPAPAAPSAAPVVTPAQIARLHLRFGWAVLAGFMALGLALEALHGFKAPWFLDADNEARRTALRLAHTHGTLFGSINVLFALSLERLHLDARGGRLISGLLRAATVLLPGGFLIGGLVIHSGDPGLGIGLVPVGAALMIAATFLISRAAFRS